MDNNELLLWFSIGVNVLTFMLVIVMQLRLISIKREAAQTQVKRKCYQCGSQIVYVDNTKPGNHYTCTKCGHTWESKY